MGLHHRHKQRILSAIVFFIALVIAADAFLILQAILGASFALLFAFACGIGLLTTFQCYNYRHSHEQATLVNTLTQMYLGSIAFASTVLVLLAQVIAPMEPITAYLALALLALGMTLLFTGYFDRFLRAEVQLRFPMGAAPAPKKVR